MWPIGTVRRERSVFASPGRCEQILLLGEDYECVGQALTFDPSDSLPRVLVSIRAAGLAAESVFYRESFENLMVDPVVRFRIKTDTDNAKRDLEARGLAPKDEEEFVSFYWRSGFHDAVSMTESSQEKVNRIAEYCLANRDREIPRAELVTNCDL
jgi:hypothetical protein